MVMKIIENWLEPELIEYLHEQFLYHTPHYYNERSSTDTLFYSHDFNHRDLLLGHLENKLKTNYLTPKHEINRIFFNVQHPGMHGSFHVDSDEESSISASLNISPEDEGVDFVYLENDVEKRITYKRNNLILFNSLYLINFTSSRRYAVCRARWSP